MATAGKRAALYHRVSTVDQNPAAARKELRAAAKRYGLRVVLDVEETGSGANNDRPGLVHIMDAARRGQVDTVLVWKLDRFGRSSLDLLTNLRTPESSGTRFVSITQGIDIRPGGEAMSRLLLTLLSAVAEFERDLGHDDHFHVRLACPDESSPCEAQAKVEAGDGCVLPRSRLGSRRKRSPHARKSTRATRPKSAPCPSFRKRATRC